MTSVASEGAWLNDLIDGEAPRIRVSGLAYDSRKAKAGDAFFALPGRNLDGFDFVAEALRRGAVVAIGQRPGPGNGRYVQVENARRALALASHRFHGDPSARMRLAGVTGTAGKTTSVYALEAILRAAGMTVGVIGTVSYRYGNVEIPSPLTTPQSLDLAALLADMARAGTQTVAMEVTSHGLDQHRTTGCHFDAIAFTNLSREHLDYHDGMESYFEAKRRLFTEYGVGHRAAVNADDPWGRQLIRGLGHPVMAFGLGRGADVRATGVELDERGARARVETPSGSFSMNSRLVGMYNVMNLLTAASLALLLDVPLDRIEEGLTQVGQVPGRLENVGLRFGRRVYIDYAHKLEPLERVLALVREMTKGRVITVFGCGGDRDKGKRPLMGQVAVRGSDVVIVTSDNPRTEEPAAILREIEEGVREEGGVRFEPPEAPGSGAGWYAIVEDRVSAIELGIELAGRHDTVLICGKGHEAHQQVGENMRRHDDRDEAIRVLEAIEHVRSVPPSGG